MDTNDRPDFVGPQPGDVLLSSNDLVAGRLTLFVWDKPDRENAAAMPFGWAIVRGRTGEVRHLAQAEAERKDAPHLVAVTDFQGVIGRAAVFAVQNVTPENIAFGGDRMADTDMDANS